MNRMTTTLLIACSISELITLTSYNSGVWVTEWGDLEEWTVDSSIATKWHVMAGSSAPGCWCVSQIYKNLQTSENPLLWIKAKTDRERFALGQKAEWRFKRFPIIHIIARQCLPAPSCGRVLEVVAPVARAKGPPRTGVGSVAARTPEPLARPLADTRCSHGDGRPSGVGYILQAL